MSSSGLTVTVVGWAATTPREVVGDGVPFTSFRVATTPRRFDARQGEWTEGRTEWLTVKAFRDVAWNVASSIRKGDPVLVHGRLRTEEWAGEEGQRTTLVVEATALGHDLTRGRGSFARSIHTGAGERSAMGTAVADGAAQPGGAGEVSGPEDPWATTPVDADEVVV